MGNPPRFLVAVAPESSFVDRIDTQGGFQSILPDLPSSSGVRLFDSIGLINQTVFLDPGRFLVGAFAEDEADSTGSTSNFVNFSGFDLDISIEATGAVDPASDPEDEIGDPSDPVLPDPNETPTNTPAGTVGLSQDNPFLPDEVSDDGLVFTFIDPISDRFFDPPAAEGFIYNIEGEGAFTLSLIHI